MKKGPRGDAGQSSIHSDCQHASRGGPFVLFFSVIVANSAPLPNIDHVMCLTGEGRGGVLLAASLNDFFLNRAHAWMSIAGLYSCMLSVSLPREATCQ